MAIHSALVRSTHWINTVSFAGLVISGIAILLAHPRLYWGETGNLNTPSILDLPLPMILTGQSGWGRSLHFLCAWIAVGSGLAYYVSGFTSGHFRADLIPDRARGYSLLQRTAYSGVVFLLFPVVVWTGLAMSPALVSVIPWLVTVLGGQQSARTIHFFISSALVLFVLIHIAMVWRAGFRVKVGAMITGGEL